MHCIIEINDWNFALVNYIVSWIWDLNYIWLIVVDGLLLPNVDLFLNDLNYLNAYHFDHMFLITNSTSLESSIFTTLHTVTILFHLQSSYNPSLLGIGPLAHLNSPDLNRGPPTFPAVIIVSRLFQTSKTCILNGYRRVNNIKYCKS